MTGIALPTRRLVSQENQALIQRPDVPRSVFMGRWGKKTTFNAGQLIPFMVDEILPGDHMRYKVTAYVRMATPLFPIFSNQEIDTFFFFVPCRLVWADWARFMGEQDSPTGDDPDDFTIPQIVSAAGGFGNSTLYDQMGIPGVGQVNGAGITSVNALPMRAYNLIYNEWFRDENLIDKRTVPTDAGPDALALYTVATRAKAHDYFTSALPWPQKFTAPTIPLLGDAPIRGLGISTADLSAATGPLSVIETEGTDDYAFYRNTASGSIPLFAKMDAATDAEPLIYADLEAVAGITINQLRQSFLVQQMLERDARGGTRYTEIVKSHFGVTSPDMRLQRPEYIGGGKTPLSITPVAQTAPSATDPVGTIGGAGTAAGQHSADYAATEHGYIIGLINVRTELAYQQGLHRMWTRRTRYDFYWPSLSGLGEQAILKQEIYHDGIAINDAVVFGYQERWHEYRTRYSEISGSFRSTTSGAIDEWHLAQEFGSTPVLGETFINDTPPMARVLAAGALADHQEYLADIVIERRATRPIPMFGTPVTLGRF